MCGAINAFTSDDDSNTIMSSMRGAEVDRALGPSEAVVGEGGGGGA